jgi:hypothetical protein
VATREIVFADPTLADNLRTRIVGLFTTMTFYLDEKPLLDSVRAHSPLSSFYDNDLTFVPIDSKFYLLDGFPISLDGMEVGKEEAQRLRKENAQKRKVEWETFINYLRDTDKIVE